MATAVKFSGELKYDNKKRQFYSQVYAYEKFDKKHSLDVYKYYEDGNSYARGNLIFNVYCGYTVEIPNKMYRPTLYSGGYYGSGKKYKAELHPYEESNQCNMSIEESKIDYEMVVERDPSLKYFVKKLTSREKIYEQTKRIHPTTFIDLMNMYRKVPQRVEPLVELDLLNIALDKRIAKLTKPKMKAVARWLVEQTPPSEVDRYYYSQTNLSQALYCMANKINYDEYIDHKECRKIEKSGTLYNYLKKQNERYKKNPLNARYYKDYMTMVANCGHNVEQDYWKYPKHLKVAHDKVSKEYSRILAVEREMRRVRYEQQRQQREEEILKNFEQYKNVVENLTKNDKAVDKYYIYIPKEIEEIKKQADYLHQCLITADYIKKVVNKLSILVFIKKDNNPVATAEITYGKKIIQFYADESDRNNCHPADDVRIAMNKWLEQATIRKAWAV